LKTLSKIRIQKLVSTIRIKKKGLAKFQIIQIKRKNIFKFNISKMFRNNKKTKVNAYIHAAFLFQS